MKTARRETDLPYELQSPPLPDPGISEERRRKTARVFSRLPPKLQVAATLALIEEQPYKEIADALGISTGAVKVRVFRALRCLRKESSIDRCDENWMAKSPDVRRALVPILPHWSPEPITLCALFSGPSRLTPKVRVLLDFLDEYLGTDRDRRLRNDLAKGYFTDRMLPQTSGP